MTLWQSFLLLFAGAFASAQRASEDGACAPASVGVCIENGYPNPGVNVDDDCCAASSGASCAEGYEYTRGGVCNRWDGRKAYDTCCTPCLAGEDCDRGPGYTCAPPWRGVCMERGYPKIGDNVDEDCCAPEGKGFCGEGYGYTMGDECYKTDGFTAYSTCCQPCDNTTGYCDDGPGNDKPPPTWRKVLIFLFVLVFTCVAGIGGVIAAICCCCRTAWTRRPGSGGALVPGVGAPREQAQMGSYIPVEMATGVVIHGDPDAGLELNDLPGATKNPFHADVDGI